MEATRLFAQYGSFGCFLSIGGTNPATYEANFALGKKKERSSLYIMIFRLALGFLIKSAVGEKQREL
jgi:hypothetical protein